MNYYYFSGLGCIFFLIIEQQYRTNEMRWLKLNALNTLNQYNIISTIYTYNVIIRCTIIILLYDMHL